MATYTVQDTTMTALGDAVRSKIIGTTELPISTFSEQYILYNKAYSFEFPTYVKKIKIVGTGRYTGVWEGNANGYQGVGIAPRVYTSEHDTRRAEGYTVVYEFDKNTLYNEKYFDFEAMVEGNSFTLVASIASSSSTSYYLTYTAIGLDENGNEFKYTPAEMVDAINGLATVPMEAFYVTGNCYSRFANGTLDWLINLYGDRVITEDITSATYMFSASSVEYIPFSINFKLNTTSSIDSMFSGAKYLKELPTMNNLKPSSISQAFYQLFRIRYIAEDIVNNWDFEYMNNSTASTAYFFSSAHSLRKIPKWHQRCWSKSTSSYSGSYNSRYGSCFALDEVKDLPVVTATFTSNMFSGFCSGTWRVKDITFMLNEDGTTQTANWKNQTIDLSSNIGYFHKSYLNDLINNYNSGITADKEVKDDATYQALKNDPDWFSTNVNYSRYNHDSAVNTINSLPDCSGSGGTNTIKFKGAAGALTDGGAINTLTEEEIAVATAKGWSVALV